MKWPKTSNQEVYVVPQARVSATTGLEEQRIEHGCLHQQAMKGSKCEQSTTSSSAEPLFLGELGGDQRAKVTGPQARRISRAVDGEGIVRLKIFLFGDQSSAHCKESICRRSLSLVVALIDVHFWNEAPAWRTGPHNKLTDSSKVLTLRVSYRTKEVSRCCITLARQSLDLAGAP
ncbi:hypothetical protein GWK47_039642 [Chionoecetes opilio]|uniref:Uncharacterized protein n=1 Tax=Chionoecetes opilio TaxID=41210 RepID=A0A8J4YCP8_CHIOP|nr:hypothetical protein GWK47_039642 [Chionoecetes opilio]